MASIKHIPCGPCQKGKVNTKADIWCYNCDEALCSPCSGHHKRSKLSCDHKTIDIKSYKPSIIKTECDKHGRQLNLYCSGHLMPCCDECISKFHSKCSGIKSLISVAEKTKLQKSKESVEKDINSILHLLDKMVNNKSTNIQTGEQQCEDIQKSFHKIREKINKHLDRLEKKFCQETDKLLDQEKLTATNFLTEIKKKKTNVQKMQEHLLSAITLSSKLQSFLGLHQIEQQVHHSKRYADDLENDDRAKEFEIKMKQNDEIENILKKLGSLESLGEVLVVYKTETDLKRETSVRRKAQVESQEQSNINNITMNIETKKDIKTEKFISDMICLKDGRVIVVEEFGKVNLLTSDGKLQKQFTIPIGAWSVTQINQNTFAITYPTEKAIKIFTMENEIVTKVITLDKECYGLSFYSNSLAVGLSYGDEGEIRIIDLEGNTLKTIQVEIELPLDYLVYYNDIVIYSYYRGKAIYCYDESGKQIWRYTQDLERPAGLCTDTYGNIIVADYNSDSIIVISKDGQSSKVLIKDGLKEPKCICFNHNESSGFICNESGTKLTRFNLFSG
ncbi:Hypothetical predicted protein [Mytilus galloprovincialis]|uniref:B box-type domain-containing protein n=1 Tax=Mytilus galloprovincialis TaxID=29158 RepID=A0A8B6ERG5_MYTGA|nr:Hypothetical predicted protein [Mytilus galloprovincialis]